MICDFCLAPDPVWDYPAAEGPALPNGPFAALAGDGYAVCADCAELVEAESWPQLVARIAEEQPKNVREGTRVEGGFVHYGDRETRMMRGAMAVTLFVEARAGETGRMRL